MKLIFAVLLMGTMQAQAAGGLAGRIMDAGRGMAEASAEICASCLPEFEGDLVHRDGTITSVYAGHAGIQSAGWIFHVTPGFGDRGLRIAFTLDKFLDGGGDFWGAKRHLHINTRTQIEARLSDKIASHLRKGIRYDAGHLNQKGKLQADGTSVFDCVGFTEHVLEYLGHNATPDSYESGAGWPLTVREQRDSIYLSNAR